MRRLVAWSVVAAFALAACAQEQQQGGAGGGGGGQAASCEPQSLDLVTTGQLTIGTDNPAFPPWFEGGTAGGSPWEINDPSTGEGYESAVAYAVAEEMGFPEEQVEWIEVPFNQSFKPGPKDFDFYMAQVSYKPARDQAVDFSESYYDANQALVSVEDSPIAGATSLEDLGGAKLGAPIGTTSYDYIVNNIQPDEEPGVYDTLNDAISALENGQIDGVVVDLPTAFFITAVQIENGVVVGQFPTVGQQEYFGLVFEDGNPLVECVNQALETLRSDGTLEAIHQRWLADKANAPVLA